MLNHSVIGPRRDGIYIVGYPTPGCDVMTVACECRTEEQALSEATRLNHEQIDREEQIQRERELRGFRRISRDLELSNDR